MKKFKRRLFWGGVVLTAYYAYKNREKIEEKLEDEKVVYYVDKAREVANNAVNTVKKELSNLSSKLETSEEVKTEEETEE